MRLLVLAAALTAAPALAGEPASFAHDGHSYSYTITESSSGRVLSGTRDDGVSFRYVIRGGRVRGTHDGRAVSFALSEVRPVVKAASGELASR
jgi:hypothetical protein